MQEYTKGGENILTSAELAQELTTIKNKMILPGAIIDKILIKLDTNSIQLTRNQLYDLINKINAALKKYKFNKSSEAAPNIFPEKKLDKPPFNLDTTISHQSMQQLIENFEKIDQRLTKLEQSAKNYTRASQQSKDLESLPSSQDQIEPLNEIVNDTEHIVVLMKWLQYLVDKIGKSQLPDILTYYVDIGWISDDIRLDMLNYSKGITEEIIKEGSKKTSQNLTTKDHIQSLLFIQKLKGYQVDERFISRIDREMQKMTRSIDQYPIN